MEKFLVIDTETVNGLDDPLCYDVGFCVTDKSGKVYESHSYIVLEIFSYFSLMQTAYYVEKMPRYWQDIAEGKRKIRRYSAIQKKVRELVKKYEITKVFAHNARFDYKSLNGTLRYLTGSKYRYFMPYGVEWWDTLKMTRQTLKGDTDYYNFCNKNNYKTMNNQYRFTAEILYRYFTNDNEFIESHTGLEDVMIERMLMVFCFARNPEIDGRLWGD